MISSPAATAAPPGQPPAIADVALGHGGMLAGQLVDVQGAPVARASVTVLQNGREVSRATTEGEGNFALLGLKGGVYEVSSLGSRGLYRLWAPDTAPPAAQHGVMLVSSADVVRGQYGPPVGPVFGPPMGPPVGPTVGPGGPPVGPPQGPFGKAFGVVANHPFIFAGAVGAAVAVPVALEDLDDDAS